MSNTKKIITNLQKKPQDEIFKKNMMALKKKHPDLAAILYNMKPDQNYAIARDHEKEPYNLVFLKKNIAYYDLFDPIGKMEEEVDQTNYHNTRLAIFFGMGLGYELLYYINNHYDDAWTEKLLLIEHDLNILYQAFHATDLTSVISRPDFQIVYVHKEDQFFNWFISFVHNLNHIRYIKTMDIIVTYGALAVYGDYYRARLEDIKQSTLATLRLLGNDPLDSLIGEDHMFENIKVIMENPGINALFKKFKGKPAIVCASGPSLKKEMDLLRSVQDKAVIITAESTLFGLMPNNIKPHMFCALERLPRKIDNYLERFDKDEVKDVYFAGVPVLPNEMFQEYNGPIINVFRAFNHFTWLPVDKGILSIKSSSANMAFKVAEAMGCNPIILLGQDLAFDRETGKTHIEEHALGGDQASVKIQERIKVLANDGEIVETSRIWNSFLQDYEIDVVDFPGEIINCSEKGAYIKGTKYMPFSEVVEKYILPNEYDALGMIKELLDESFATSQIKSDVEKLKNKLKIAVKDLNFMLKDCDKACEKILKYKEVFAPEYDGESIDVSRKYKIASAYEEIMKLKIGMWQGNETFSGLVLHMVQPYICSFDIQFYSELDNLETLEETYLYTIERHYGYFKRLYTLIEMLKKSVLKADKTVNEYYEEILRDEKEKAVTA